MARPLGRVVVTPEQRSAILSIVTTANLGPDYTPVREDPPPDGRSRQEGPLIKNMREAMTTPAEPWRISHYSGRKTADTIANELRRGKRPVPRDTELSEWTFVVRQLEDEAGQKLDRFGIWATFRAESEVESATA